MKIMKSFFISILAIIALGFFTGVADAHPGRTDSSGGHTCRTNCESWGLSTGEYHYHNGGSSTNTAPIVQPTQTPQVIEKQTTTVTEPVVTTKKLIEQIRDLVKERKESRLLWSDLILSRLQGRTVTKTITRTVSPQQSLANQPDVPQAVNQSASTKQPQEGFYQVTSVVDGDTIRVMYNGKIEAVRILAMDTPETRDPRKPVQCYGDAASKKMSEFVAGQNVRLERDGTQPDRDKYLRLLRYVYLENGTDVGAEMIKQGFAFAYTRFPSDKLDEYRGYERQARETSAGLWGSCEIQENGNTKSTNAAQ